MGNPVARIGDSSSHGGTITTSASKSICEGKLIARVTDLLACPIHGSNPIVTGSPKFITEGQLTARTGSLTQCGASIIGGATKTVCE
jgi:uncharacterized Zn-binding protein involved in type VI secretion